MLRRKVGLGLLGAGVGVALWERYNESYNFTRTLRTVRCGLYILYSYKLAFNADNYYEIH